MLAIVDYKTSTDPDPAAAADYDLQLAVYADAGRGEGLNVRAAYIHDLGDAARKPVDVGAEAITQAEAEVAGSVRGLRNREFKANPGHSRRRCDLKRLCRWNAA